MFQTLRMMWKTRDLRNDILFVLAMLVIVRFVAHIPIPGVDVGNLQRFFQQNQFLGLLNVFSGGGLEQFSVVALGVGPYITSSIIFQLLTMIVPSLEELMKEGEAGQQKMNQYTRLATVPLALLQGYGIITLLTRTSNNIFPQLSVTQYAVALLTMTAGTIFLMWIGELITERNVGNGISLLIFVGIIARLPLDTMRFFASYDSSQLLTVIAFILIAVVTIAGVVVLTEGQRNIPVNYAKIVRGNRLVGGVNTHLPLRVNQGGVIPIIFAISILLFPPTIAQFLRVSHIAWLAHGAQWVIDVFQNQLFYGILYFFLVIVFTYFYTAVIFHPDKVSEHLQKQGGFIPGIRPGKPTADYLGTVVNRIILAGALFLGVIAVLPLMVKSATGIDAFAVGGTSLLIVVSVVIETRAQIEAQLSMRQYEGY